MRTALPRFALLGLTLVTTACSRGARRSELPPRAETAVKVNNQNYLDMNVYVVRGGQRLRLGTARGLSTQVFMLRPEIVGNVNELQFEVHPIGGRGNPRTERITVHPGDVIELTIPP